MNSGDTVWVCGWYADYETGEWVLTGVFTSESLAMGACVDDTYFIGPVILNELPGETSEWAGLYHPLAH